MRGGSRIANTMRLDGRALRLVPLPRSPSQHRSRRFGIPTLRSTHVEAGRPDASYRASRRRPHAVQLPTPVRRSIAPQADDALASKRLSAARFQHRSTCRHRARGEVDTHRPAASNEWTSAPIAGPRILCGPSSPQELSRQHVRACEDRNPTSRNREGGQQQEPDALLDHRESAERDGQPQPNAADPVPKESTRLRARREEVEIRPTAVPIAADHQVEDCRRTGESGGEAGPSVRSVRPNGRCRSALGGLSRARSRRSHFHRCRTAHRFRHRDAQARLRRHRVHRGIAQRVAGHRVHHHQ